MPRAFVYAVSYAALYVLSCVLPFALKTAPNRQLWKGYRVAAVASSYPETELLLSLERAGIDGVVSYTANLPNKNLSAFSVAFCAREDSYQSQKLLYFFDKSQKWRLLYIPQQYSAAARTVFDALPVPFWFEEDTVKPLFPVFLSAAVIAFFFICSKRKMLFALFAVPALIFAACFPFYAVCAGLCAQAAAVYLFSAVYNRKNALRVLLRSPLFLIYAASALLLFALSGWKAALCALVLAAGFASASALAANGALRANALLVRRFVPVFIINAKTSAKNAAADKPSVLFAVPAASALLAVQLALFASPASSSSKPSRLSIPCRIEYTKAMSLSAESCMELYKKDCGSPLPDMGAFISRKWYADTFLFRKLSDAAEENRPAAGETVACVQYSLEGNRIAETMTEKYVFDDAYIAHAADSAAYGASSLEQLFIAQRSFFDADFAVPSARHSESFVPAKLLCCFLLSAAAGVIFFIRRKYDSR
ncbi:MAG: hypothetical protein NC041_04285 [Bacteroides sp.]|nr:hypothetical protein [Prevotella sp.]MCM1407924.1 hypothetical protein [Treponema brennaborense]MCM1469666.1 hypothetical protein [Bacteroides sp.]